MGAEAYRSRKRTIYALLFHHNRACYIGQSVNPKRRLQQHQGTNGGWNMVLHMVILHEFEGTKAQGEQLEYAYRLKALRKGWKVYGLPHVIIDPKKQATTSQWWTSLSLPWPQEHNHRRRWWLWAMIPVVLMAGAYML